MSNLHGVGAGLKAGFQWQLAGRPQWFDANSRIAGRRQRLWANSMTTDFLMEGIAVPSAADRRGWWVDQRSHAHQYCDKVTVGARHDKQVPYEMAVFHAIIQSIKCRAKRVSQATRRQP